MREARGARVAAALCAGLVYTLIISAVMPGSIEYTEETVPAEIVLSETAPPIEAVPAEIVLSETAPPTETVPARIALSELAAWDAVPPTISGELHKTIPVGGTVSYKAGVTVHDDRDDNPRLSVDSSQVNRKTPGVYDVVYTATDASGNQRRETGTVTVQAVDKAMADEMADEILAQLVTDDMSQREQAYAIYTWVAEKVKYQSGDSPRELAQGAYVCYTKGVGDCYVYKAGVQVLLERAGIDYREVRRHGGKTEHFWLLVNTGDGWYHVDASANNVLSQEERFMFTDSQARAYTKRIGGGRAYYQYDPDGLPEVAE